MMITCRLQNKRRRGKSLDDWVTFSEAWGLYRDVAFIDKTSARIRTFSEHTQDNLLKTFGTREHY